jgi:hypothetical protein
MPNCVTYVPGIKWYLCVGKLRIGFRPNFSVAYRFLLIFSSALPQFLPLHTDITDSRFCSTCGFSKTDIVRPVDEEMHEQIGRCSNQQA